MRLLATVANLVLLGFAVYVVSKDGLPADAFNQRFLAAVLVAPSLSLLVLWSKHSLIPANSWLGIFLERKRSEELLKLKQLRDQQK